MKARIDGVRVNLYRHGNCGACIYVGESEKTGGDADRLDELLAKEVGDIGYNLIVFEISDWNSQLSPWPARPAFGDEAFNGRGLFYGRYGDDFFLQPCAGSDTALIVFRFDFSN